MSDETMVGPLLMLTVAEGKYTFIQRADGSTMALRYNEPWMESCQVPGANMWLAMAYELDEYRKAAMTIPQLRALFAIALTTIEPGVDARRGLTDEEIETLIRSVVPESMIRDA